MGLGRTGPGPPGETKLTRKPVAWGGESDTKLARSGETKRAPLRRKRSGAQAPPLERGGLGGNLELPGELSLEQSQRVALGSAREPGESLQRLPDVVVGLLAGEATGAEGVPSALEHLPNVPRPRRSERELGRGEHGVALANALESLRDAAGSVGSPPERDALGPTALAALAALAARQDRREDQARLASLGVRRASRGAGEDHRAQTEPVGLGEQGQQRLGYGVLPEPLAKARCALRALRLGSEVTELCQHGAGLAERAEGAREHFALGVVLGTHKECQNGRVVLEDGHNELQGPSGGRFAPLGGGLW